ncbi:hypothetical protein EJ05DRAFT_537396 [Pseudovirgaria hyperparasitica]|uniref:Homeobox domain-containing protein n=1 Tax=Pseudovirgaria hyperparasitica TaxID=470096 RepID=A0A6A6W853_9PEZI|nr:uncharacterized protein EJ05DRAFT_537396 [Pseudovirgaria hyperparasitica]KAF2759032.1 hypothetical protein EJ05DRAFT_537396 [Pseudovirgaria hyperparasitica]
MSHASDPSSSQPDARLPASSISPTQSLAFVVHSPDTVQNNLPPDVDNKPLARQKRRRTSKEDEEILRAEYEKNSKPDKATRLDIVSRVALGEKEVQIWFQNRRQNDRRKSRPQNSDVPSSDRLDCSSDYQDNIEDHNEILEGCEVEPSLNVDAPRTEEIREDADAEDITTGTSSQRTGNASSFTQLTDSQPTFSSQGNQFPLNRPSGYIANRRSASFVKIFEDSSSSQPTTETHKTETSQDSRPLPRSRSFVRLSMTADGQAKVVTDADQSPSPPRPQASSTTPTERSGSLRRSYSAAGLHERFQDEEDLSPAPKLLRTTGSHGRSRDSRTWEFWCDSDARKALANQADQEGKGSAANAISLIRANSSGALRSTPSKRNMMLAKQSSSRGVKPDGKKIGGPGLTRFSTAQGRLHMQSRQPDLTKMKSKKKKDDESEEIEILNTESDKENWEPNDVQTALGSTETRRHNQVSSGRRPLGENTTIMSQSSSLGSMMRRERKPKSQLGNKSIDAENMDPEDDEEIAQFMGSARPSSPRASSLSSGEDMSCVQGLLKLSQGNWR